MGHSGRERRPGLSRSGRRLQGRPGGVSSHRTGRPLSRRPAAIFRPMPTPYVLRTDPPGPPMTSFALRPSIAALALVTALAAPALAQDRRVPTSDAELKLSYAPLVKNVAPAVVNVYAAKVVQNRIPLFDDPIFRQFFNSHDQPNNTPQKQRSLGSGVIVDPSG